MDRGSLYPEITKQGKQKAVGSSGGESTKESGLGAASVAAVTSHKYVCDLPTIHKSFCNEDQMAKEPIPPPPKPVGYDAATQPTSPPPPRKQGKMRIYIVEAEGDAVGEALKKMQQLFTN